VGDIEVEGAVELACAFLTAGYAHLPPGTPVMYRLDTRDHRVVILLLLTVTFTNPYDTFTLIGQVFWCGCEFIAFTMFNIFTNFECIFPPQTKCTPSPKTSTMKIKLASEPEDGGETTKACHVLVLSSSLFWFPCLSMLCCVYRLM
jgi:hypothetical protein